MDSLKSENNSSTNGSDGDESSAASPVESVHSRGSYVRSRPLRRLSFSPPGSTSYGAAIQYHNQDEYPPQLEKRSRNVRIHVEEDYTDSQVSDDSRDVPLGNRYGLRSISQRRSRSPEYTLRGGRAPPRPYSSDAPYYFVNSRSSSPSDSSLSSLSHSPPSPRFRPSEVVTVVRPHQTSAKAPSYHSTGNIHADPADASEDEHIRVHHVINIRPSYSIYGRDNEQNPKLRSRVFTHQPSFKHEENLPPETYHIIHTRLVPREDEHTHDIAVLTYDEGATRTETEISWM
ncbi:Mg2+ transporter protein CorA-like/Zinc transport protein ZntB [Penicillium maclennaniae]|uniref:Mg2+ transporter protein CorA-like/Zinc transport protein ZntB n=1 Tax=Penicillium maclennaniae TaxID=1343394 RepID=UPI0025404A59|nr:Mg2+ transporter protein CorA-like/Zinc transport protein ZntB [Penicillium maclennaniae]KAJ5677097.1 Mg2+ transporter protein CorA-like/Zinc transport protein ZntB [Penicillium maclennaniae]